MSWTSRSTALCTETVGVPFPVEIGEVVEFPVRKTYAPATTRMTTNATGTASLETPILLRALDTLRRTLGLYLRLRIDMKRTHGQAWVDPDSQQGPSEL